MKKTIVYLAMSSCFILGTSMAYADSDSSQGKMDHKVFKMDETMFKAMDKDSNGKVANHEFINYTKKKYDDMDFHTLDVDGDDNITPSEIKIVSQRSEQKSAGSSEEAGKMDDTWDQKRDDAWHKNSDSAWDKNRDDTWHKKSDNTSSGGTQGKRTSSGGFSSQERGGASGGSSRDGSGSGGYRSGGSDSGGH